MEVKKKTYNELRTIAKKFEPVENISMHLQITSIQYVKYRSEESEDKALRKLINKERVAETTTKEPKKKEE